MCRSDLSSKRAKAEAERIQREEEARQTRRKTELERKQRELPAVPPADAKGA